MQRNHALLLSLILFTSLCSSYASAWCVAGIGNTCGDASREDNWFSQYFNFNKPTPTDTFDVWGIGETVGKIYDTVVDGVKNIIKPAKPEEKPQTPPETQIESKGDKIKNKDSRGNEVTSTFTEVSKTKVGAEDPWYYDLDVIKINGHQCVGCKTSTPDIPGFDYEFDIVIRNTGNVACDGVFTIEVIAEDQQSGELYYNEVVHRPGFAVGTAVIPVKVYDVGLESKNLLKPSSIYTGVFDSRQLPMKVTVRLIDDDKEVEAGFVEYEKKERKCKQECEEDEDGEETCSTKCSTSTRIVRETIHAKYSDPAGDDTSKYEFNLNKLTSEVKGGAALSLK